MEEKAKTKAKEGFTTQATKLVAKIQPTKEQAKTLNNKKDENKATARGLSLAISTKKAIAVCDLLRGKKIAEAKAITKRVIEKKQAVPFKRYKMDMGHKKGKIAAGRYPLAVCKEMIKLLKNVETNAENKGLNIESLIITKILANQAARPLRYGRHRGRHTKRTNIEVVVAETEVKDKKEKGIKKSKQETKNQEKKKQEAHEEKK